MFDKFSPDIFIGQKHEDEGFRSCQENECQEGADATIQNCWTNVGQSTADSIFPASLILNKKPTENFTNILQATFVLIFFCNINTKGGVVKVEI